MERTEWAVTQDQECERVEQDHHALLGAIRRLQTAVDKQGDAAEVTETLAFLRDYTVNHFAAEEALMVRHGYPGAAAHFTAHTDLVVQVSDLLSDLRGGETRLSREVLAFLDRWLVSHIQGMDRDLLRYLKRQA
jgi:hemerythrin-like metal-binding protein